MRVVRSARRRRRFCEHIEGKTLEEIEAFSAAAMLDLLKVRLTAMRQRCGLLGFKVLKTLAYSYDGSHDGAAEASA